MAAKGGKKAAEEAAEKKGLEEKVDQLGAIIVDLGNRLALSRTGRSKKLPLLDSVSLGLYEELDKLSKKAPAETVTDLVLGQLNDVIRETKELVTDDPFVQRLNEFVPAGDNPQLRDAVVVLRQIRQGLERFREKIGPFEEKASGLLVEARVIRAALQHYLDTGYAPDRDELNDTVGTIPRTWLTSEPYPGHFNLRKLGQTVLKEYFTVE